MEQHIERQNILFCRNKQKKKLKEFNKIFLYKASMQTINCEGVSNTLQLFVCITQYLGIHTHDTACAWHYTSVCVCVTVYRFNTPHLYVQSK